MLAVATIGNSAVCCVFCREQGVYAVGNVEMSVCVCCGYCREQCVCALATVGNSDCVLCVL